MNELDSLLDELEDETLCKDYSPVWSREARHCARHSNDRLCDVTDKIRNGEIEAFLCWSEAMDDYFIIADTDKRARVIKEQACPFAVYLFEELSYITQMMKYDPTFLMEVHNIKKHFDCYIDAFTISPQNIQE